MSLLARLLPQQRPTPGADAEKRMLTSSAFAPPVAGYGVDLMGELHAMQSMAVFACIRLLADSIASMPWHVYKRDNHNVPQRIYPTPAVVRKPCADMDLFQWKWMVVATLALRGNSYHVVISRDKTGNPTGLMPVHPDLVWLERRVNVLEWYDPIYRVLGERIPREDIIHIRRFTMPGEPWGLSPIRQAARAIGINLAADEYGYRYFKDSANPSGVLKTDQTLTDEEIEQNQAQWMASHGGRRFPAILSGGFDFQALSITPEESQFLESRRYQVQDIARFYGVPPHMVGDVAGSTSWGSGIAQQSLGFLTYTLQGWTTCIESAISNFLPRGHAVRFDPNALLRGDIKTRYDSYESARNAGWLSTNEIRHREELPPIPNGDGYIQPLNYGPLGFDPAVTAMPKTVPAGTDPDHATGTPAAATGQEPEPGGMRSRSSLALRLDRDGKPQYYDARTGETVLFSPKDIR